MDVLVVLVDVVLVLLVDVVVVGATVVVVVVVVLQHSYPLISTQVPFLGLLGLHCALMGTIFPVPSYRTYNFSRLLLLAISVNFKLVEW